MIPFYTYIGDTLKGKNVHFKCSCAIPLDVTGRCVDYSIKDTEVIFDVHTGTKMLKIGSNSPGLEIEILS